MLGIQLGGVAYRFDPSRREETRREPLRDAFCPLPNQATAFRFGVLRCCVNASFRASARENDPFT